MHLIEEEKSNVENSCIFVHGSSNEENLGVESEEQSESESVRPKNLPLKIREDIDKDISPQIKSKIESSDSLQNS